jgi:hypothetical protein
MVLPILLLVVAAEPTARAQVSLSGDTRGLRLLVEERLGSTSREVTACSAPCSEWLDIGARRFKVSGLEMPDSDFFSLEGHGEAIAVRVIPGSRVMRTVGWVAFAFFLNVTAILAFFRYPELNRPCLRRGLFGSCAEEGPPPPMSEYIATLSVPVGLSLGGLAIALLAPRTTVEISP